MPLSYDEKLKSSYSVQEAHECRSLSQDGSPSVEKRESYLTPYLGLQARLSQTWINRWTVLLLLVLVRTLFAIASLDDNLATAKKQALSACTSVENVGSAMASMPHYMSHGVNTLTADGIDKAINGLMQMLILSITVVEELVLFVINMLTSTYVCLITLVISGSLHVAIHVAEDVGNFLNSTVQDIGKDLAHTADDFRSAMNSFLKGINNVGDFFSGKSSQPPTVNFSDDLNKLSSLSLPSGYDQGLEKLNASIPNYDQVKNFTDHAIRLPFEEIKKLLNHSLPTYAMDRSLFPVPAKEHLSFCSDNNGISDFFVKLVAIAHLVKKIFLVVIIIAALLAMVPMAYREMRRYRFMKQRAQLITTDSRDPMDSVYLVSRPYTSSAGLWLSRKLSSLRHRVLVRWTVAYATTTPALFVLSLALAGLLACLCQYILLKAIEKEVPALENQVIDFSNHVVYKLNNASEQWAIGTNKMITQTNTTINHDVFGWVNTSTTAINNTLNVFVDEMTNALNKTFGGTILYEPISEIFHCLIGLKVESFEKGLTWVHDHAHIDFPLLANDTFSLKTIAKGSGSDSDLLSTNPADGTADEITAAVYHVTNFLAKGIRQEAIISTCLLLVWVLIVLIGIAQALFLCAKKDVGLYDFAVHESTKPQTAMRKSIEIDDHSSREAPSDASFTIPHNPRNDPGNTYNGQAYTLTPAAPPQFRADPSTSPILNTGFDAGNERLGHVGAQNLDAAIRRSPHARTSSYGDVAIMTPTSRSAQNNHFTRMTKSFKTLIKQHHNPFADPRR